MSLSTGSADVRVGIVDGPFDWNHRHLTSPTIEHLVNGTLRCDPNQQGLGLHHGTAMAGILFGRRESGAPGICPTCSYVLYPVFCDPDSTDPARHRQVNVTDLAQAIVSTVDAGARLVNLSLGVVDTSLVDYRELSRACEHARRKGALLICATGNQGHLGSVPLTRHPWPVPVVACDRLGRPLASANLSPAIGARGVMAPGDSILTTVPGQEMNHVSGTSAATALVTGALALLWSLHPQLDAEQLRSVILKSSARPKRCLVPPLLDMAAARRLVQQVTSRSKEISMYAADVFPPRAGTATPRASSARAQVAAQAESCPTCAAGGAGGTGGTQEPPSYIYSIGTVNMRFPSPGIEKEFAQAAASLGGSASLTDRQLVHQTLVEHRYLANEVCWAYSIENTDTYLLLPRDAQTLDKFIAAVHPSSQGQGQGIDIDVIIGQRGPLAQPEMCNGLVVPLVLVDQMYSFNQADLISAIAKPAHSKASDDNFRRNADELFQRILQMADNVGSSDEHRALNYLSVRYQRIYECASEMQHRDFSLSAVEVIPSRLTGARRLVDVILKFTNRKTDVDEKFYVRVDVTEKFPFVDRKLSPFYDR